MRGVTVGLLVGLGLFCIWWSFWPRQERRAEPARPGVRSRLQDDITQAGYTSVSPGNVLTAGVLAGLLVFALMQASTRVVPVALCFGVMAACLRDVPPVTPGGLTLMHRLGLGAAQPNRVPGQPPRFVGRFRALVVGAPRREVVK